MKLFLSMKSIRTLLWMCLLFVSGFGLNLKAQETKPEFTAEWKADTVNHIVVVKAPEVSTPYTVFIYDANPFEGGTVLDKKEVILNQTTEIELNKKIKVCVCVVKDAMDFKCKWLDNK